MKKHIYIILKCLLALLLCPLSQMYGRTFTENGFTYLIQRDSISVSLIGYQPSVIVENKPLLHFPASVVHEGQTYQVNYIGPDALNGLVSIERIVVEEGIKDIGNRAFECCTSLKSIYLPASLDGVAHGIFGSCYNLREIVVDPRNECLDSRDNCNAIIDSDDDKLLAACPVTKIPNSVKSIAKRAFYHCNTMEELDIPEGVETIESFAFNDCSQLKRVSLPQSLHKIEESAFYRCNSLESVFIPKNVCDIEEANIFPQCYNLASIVVDDANPIYDSRSNCNGIVRKSDSTLIATCKATVIPGNVKRLGHKCFLGTRMFSVRIPKTVIEIAKMAFFGCDELDTLNVDADNPVYMSPSGTNAIMTKDGKTLVLGGCTTDIPNGIETIGAYAFSGRYPKTMLKIPEGVKSIGEGAFRDCSYISDIVIPTSVIDIGMSAFEKCFFLKSVQLLSPVEYINPYTFSGCVRLTVVDIPEGVKEICNWAFDNCTGLKYVHLPSSIETVEREAFANCPVSEKK